MNKELNAAEAVYGFVGWLTTREERTVMSAKDDCAPIAELIKRFCTENNLPEVSDQWPLNLIHPSGEVAVPNAIYPSAFPGETTKETNMSQEKLDHVVAGAIFDFMGWLTTRQEKLVLSSVDDAAPAAEAVKEFLTMRGVAQDCEPMIHDWPARCSMVTANVRAKAGQTAQEEP